MPENVYNLAMTAHTLELHNRAQISDLLGDDVWLVACLCAAWCDVCKTYRPLFDAFAARHPDKCFLWIDVEDQADLVGDFDIENFPTLLLQRGDSVAFFGTVMPDIQIATRLLASLTEKPPERIERDVVASPPQNALQQQCNLRKLLQQTP